MPIGIKKRPATTATTEREPHYHPIAAKSIHYDWLDDAAVVPAALVAWLQHYPRIEATGRREGWTAFESPSSSYIDRQRGLGAL